MKKMKTLLTAMVLVGSVGWAEDEDSDTVVNAISSGSGVNYKVGPGRVGGEVGPAILRGEIGVEERQFLHRRGGGVGLDHDVGSER